MEPNKFKKQNILTQSERMSEEYCCNIIRVGELIPIPGSDFLAQTFINGDSVVVRKDDVKTGDVFFFAMCECQLSHKYLGHHSMFRRSGAEANANYPEVASNIQKIKDIKKELEKADKYLNKISSFLKKKGIGHELEKFSKLPVSEDNKPTPDEIRNACQERLTKEREALKAKRAEFDVLIKSVDKKCGFFEPTGRIKAIKLKQTPSMGFMFSQESLAAVYPEVADLNLEDYMGYDFDTVCGELFCKAYVPKLPKSQSANNKLSGQSIADSINEGEFVFHYDTSLFAKNIWKFMPDDIIDVTDKIHGTSFIMSNCHVKYEKNLSVFTRIWNKTMRFLRLKCLMATETVEGLANVFSSRKLIRNTGFKEDQAPEYPDSIYGLWASLLQGVLLPGQTVYGEIYGWDPCSGKPIQPGYNYGCKPGESIFMPYRITDTNWETETTREFTICEVLDWTKMAMDFFKRHNPDSPHKVEEMTRFYHGTIKELYPKVDYTSETWRDEVLRLMAQEKLFHMEEMDERCTPTVPREGVVIRRLADRTPSAYKLKCLAFKERESAVIDSGQISDAEMEEAYS